jgi:hypothetical protein
MGGCRFKRLLIMETPMINAGWGVGIAREFGVLGIDFED